MAPDIVVVVTKIGDYQVMQKIIQILSCEMSWHKLCQGSNDNLHDA